jgi:N6-L-threonylcarbamoyladenine synthase
MDRPVRRDGRWGDNERLSGDDMATSPIRVLGIESSCDETAASVVENGTTILSSVVRSQVKLHAPYGGVVPEIAARDHLEAIRPVTEKALEESGVDAAALDGIAVTHGPGLVGCLLVGVAFARAYGKGLGLPVVGVNHLEGHVESAFFEKPDLELPALALVVSGGHTHLWHMTAHGAYRLLARTRDDAAGEAFDKVAKMLGLGYPGGPVIDRLAEQGDPRAVAFRPVKISDGSLDLSYSGLKTAVRHHIETTGLAPLASPDDEPSQEIIDLVASVRAAIVRQLIDRTRRCGEGLDVKTLIVAGGVAANKLLRREATILAGEMGWDVSIPALRFCVDNAAMIAAAGTHLLARGENHIDDLDASPGLRLGSRRAAS